MKQVSVAGIVTQGPYALVGQKNPQASDRIRGLWHFPGGGLQPNESILEAIAREFKEETNLDVIAKKHLATSTSPKGKILHWYSCNPTSHQLIPGSDLTAVKYIFIPELKHHCRELYNEWPQEVKSHLRQTFKQHNHLYSS